MHVRDPRRRRGPAHLRSARRRLHLLSAAGLACVAIFATTGLTYPAQGDNRAGSGEDHGQPPVTVADQVTVNQGEKGTVTVPVLANDSDPDGDTISLCGVAHILPKYGVAMESGNQIRVDPNGQNTQTFTIKYWVCDDWYRVDTGILKVKVDPVDHLKVKLLRHRVFSVRNDGPFFATFTYGVHKQNVDNLVNIRSGAHRTIKLSKQTLRRGYVEWWAIVDMDDGGWTSAGHGRFKLH